MAHLKDPELEVCQSWDYKLSIDGVVTCVQSHFPRFDSLNSEIPWLYTPLKTKNVGRDPNDIYQELLVWIDDHVNDIFLAEANVDTEDGVFVISAYRNLPDLLTVREQWGGFVYTDNRYLPRERKVLGRNFPNLSAAKNIDKAIKKVII